MSKFICDVKNFLFNVGMDVKYAPLMAELEMREKNEKRKKEKVEKNEKEEILEQYYDLSEEIDAIPNQLLSKWFAIDKKNQFLYWATYKKINDANKWIIYVMAYLKNSDTKLITAVTEKEGALANAIAELAGYPKIYPGNSVADLRKYDPTYTDIESIPDYCLLISNIVDRIVKKGILSKKMQERNYSPEEVTFIKEVTSFIKAVPSRDGSALGFRIVDIVDDYKNKYRAIQIIDAITGERFYLYEDEQCGKKLKSMLTSAYCVSGILDKYALILRTFLPQYENCADRTKVCQKVDYKYNDFLTPEKYNQLEEQLKERIDCVYDGWMSLQSSSMLKEGVASYWKNKYSQLESVIEAHKSMQKKRAEAEQKKEAERLQAEKNEKIKAAGRAGEKEVTYQLRTGLSKEYLLVNNGEPLVVCDGDTKHEIDHIVIGPRGVIMIETKAYSGIIEIDQSGNWLRYDSVNGSKYGERNPIGQINRHHIALERLLQIEEIYDIICFSRDDSIINGVENSKIPIVKADTVAYYIHKELVYLGEKTYSAEERLELKEKLESLMGEK